MPADASPATISSRETAKQCYLGRLSKRMATPHFPHDDPLRVLVDRAEDAVHRLRIDVHYRSVEARRKAAAQTRRPTMGGSPCICIRSRDVTFVLPATHGLV
jgi:hypothetical protein